MRQYRRDEIKDGPIWVSIHVTTDKGDRLLAKVVIGLLSEQYSKRILLHCDYLEKCINRIIVKLFMNLYESYGEKVLCKIMYYSLLVMLPFARSKLDKHYLLFILNDSIHLLGICISSYSRSGKGNYPKVDLLISSVKEKASS